MRVLRTLALLRGLDPKPRILIDLAPANFESDWEHAAPAMEKALELVTLVGAIRCVRREVAPGVRLDPVLAALRAQIEVGD
jgi:hypothetical protein